MNRVTLLFIVFTLMSSNALGQEVVYLKNGSEIHGTIIELVPDDYLKIKTKDGNVFVFKLNEVARITKEQTAPDDGTSGVIQPPATAQGVTAVSFDGRLGLFIPNEEAVKDIYGNGFIFGAGIRMIGQKDFGGELALSYFSKSGEPIEFDPYGMIKDSKAEITLISIPISGFYRHRMDKTILYFGGGLGLYMVKEELEIDYYEYSSERFKFDDNAIGFQLFSEVEFKLGEMDGFIRLNYSTASIKGEGAGGNSVDAGGVSFMGGIRF